LPANATDLGQPGDLFGISRIKDVWKREWDQYKAGEIAHGSWMGSREGSSGKLKNLGRLSFSSWQQMQFVSSTHRETRMDSRMRGRL